MKLEPRNVQYFATSAELRDWFDANHQTADELWLAYHKKATGRPTVSWSLAVDEALCVGWIDSIRVGMNAETSAQRFTPRRKGSTWSAINVAKIASLTAEGRMRPAGLAAFEARTAAKTGIYSYEREAAAFSADEEARFRANAAAWADWQKRTPSYRKTVVHWVTDAKQAATRERRMDALIADSEAGQPIRPLRWARDATKR